MTTSLEEQLESVVQDRLESLDDTDCYASAWSEALLRAAAESSSNALPSWGGRGKGGRGAARRTYQPRDVSVDDVRLEYVSNAAPSLPGRVLLDGATLRFHPGRVYALVGRNACGKSTLLQRIASGRIPGFPPFHSPLYLPQEVVVAANPDRTGLDLVLGQHDVFFRNSEDALRRRIHELEGQMDDLDMSSESGEKRAEEICEQISALEEECEGGGHDVDVVRQHAQDAMRFFGIDEGTWNRPTHLLSGGQLKKIILSCALFCDHKLLLLDEPTNFLDVPGLIQLRRLIQLSVERKTIVLIVSHDIDLINDVATDVIHFANSTLTYYPGNYRDFQGYKNQRELHQIRQNAALEKKREAMLNTIETMKGQPIPKRGGARKKGRQIESKKKQLEKMGIERDEKGHRWTAQKAGSAIKQGSINGLDESTRKRLSHAQLMKKTGVAPVPDKAVQFVFRNTTSRWGEPLIRAVDVGHGYGSTDDRPSQVGAGGSITKKKGFLFDCVDLSIDEGVITCILGESSSGKSTLLRLLAKEEEPLEGTITHALNANVGYFSQHVADELIQGPTDQDKVFTPLSLLRHRFPLKTEQEIRGELTAFGLEPKQATTNLKFLSGGERSRLCLANLMLSDPQVLLLDEPTSHLDAESVEALIYGLSHWNGTLVMVSHDSNLIRSLGGTCYVIMPEEGKIRRVVDGIDGYLRAFKTTL